MKTLKEIILWVWQLPQNLLGLFLLLWFKHEKVFYKLNGRLFYYTSEMSGGISLGNYIILRRNNNNRVIRHEYGHTIQSRILGPLYLLVIGLPSIIHAALHSDKYGSYYHFYTESWADNLAAKYIKNNE